MEDKASTWLRCLMSIFSSPVRPNVLLSLLSVQGNKYQSLLDNICSAVTSLPGIFNDISVFMQC